MNRDELKKVVEDNGCRIETNGEWIDFYAIDSKLGYVSEEYKAVFTVYDNCPRALAQVMLDYSYTELEEREEEKKYYLLFPDEFSIHPGNNNQWLLGKDSQGRYDEVSISTKHVQNMFTQKEIDEMPKSWRDFFIKEEVKND